jgi:hypothetical protein
VANDGQTYRIMWSSEGTPWSDLFSMFSTTTSKPDYTPAFWGLEIDNTLWTHEGDLLSFGAGLGMYYHRYTNVEGFSLDRDTFSLPVTLTASTSPLSGLKIYANAGVGPWGYLKKQITYNHYEAGVIYDVTENIRLNASYRTANDFLSSDPKDLNHGKYGATSSSFGIGYYF